MAHEHVKGDLHLESATGRVSLQILATLVGGMLLLCAVTAKFLYDNSFYEDTLGAIAAVLLGAPLIWVAVKDLINGHMHMNELVALAVLAAFAKGMYLEAGAIAFFMILSVLVENRTALGAQASIESLIKITPTRAHRLSEGDQETEVDAAQLQPGDVVRVRPGDNIPADGRVIRGTSSVNQANITGESLPADKAEGDDVFSGTINLTGAMDLEVTKAGQDTTLGRVKDLILQAERTRTPIMRMIDRYAAWYTPTVLMIVLIIFVFTFKADKEGAFERAIAMLVVACPCALILATPTAMVAALSSAARLGVLIKSVTDLESARNLSAIIFDKTGTLTTGNLEVTKLTPMPGVDGAELLRVAAAAEQNSKHPVARAVTKVARKARLHLAEPSAFEEVSGRGVTATVDGTRVAVGKANWLTEDGLGPEIVAAINNAQNSPEADGLSLLFVVRDDVLLGWIALADNTRPQAGDAMVRLRELGLKRLFIVTGDRESVARRVAEQMHTEYRSEVLPHEKLEIVDELKAKGHHVAVVGDGVNDAPALAAGDIGIAMGAAGSDVAIHSATIALMNNNLDRIPFLVDLSRRTSRVINQNLVIGGGFIVSFLALSALGWVTAIVAAVLHLVSGLVVVFNSARLVRAGEHIELAESAELEKLKNLKGAVPSSGIPRPALAPAG